MTDDGALSSDVRQLLGIEAARMPVSTKTSGSQRRRKANALPRKLFVFSYSSDRGSSQIHGAITFEDVHTLADMSQPAFIKDQRRFWKTRNCVVWTVSHQLALDQPIVIADASTTPRVKSIGQFRASPVLRDISKQLKYPAACSAIRLPEELAGHVLDASNGHLVTPSRYVIDCGIAAPDETKSWSEQGVALCPRLAVKPNSFTTTSWGSCVDHSFHPNVIVICWLLQAQAKSWSTPLEPLTLAACRIAMPPCELIDLQRKISDKSLQIPAASSMVKVGSKMFVLDILFDRESMPTTPASRHWMPDSSPQGSWNFLVTVEHRIEYPSSFSSADFAGMRLPHMDTGFNLLPWVTLGYGLSGVTNKVSLQPEHAQHTQVTSPPISSNMLLECLCQNKVLHCKANMLQTSFPTHYEIVFVTRPDQTRCFNTLVHWLSVCGTEGFGHPSPVRNPNRRSAQIDTAPLRSPHVYFRSG